MKKVAVLAGVVVSLLAGCSSSIAFAHSQPSQTAATNLALYSNSYQMMKIQSNTVKLKHAVQEAMRRVNRTYYVYSGETPYGWDCSGLVRWVYKQVGIVLPHSATAQAHLGKRVHKPKLGDIVVFGYGNYYFDHAGIYIGKGKIVDANSFFGKTVIEPLSNFKYYQNIRYVRVITTN